MAVDRWLRGWHGNARVGYVRVSCDIRGRDVDFELLGEGCMCSKGAQILLVIKFANIAVRIYIAHVDRGRGCKLEFGPGHAFELLE